MGTGVEIGFFPLKVVFQPAKFSPTVKFQFPGNRLTPHFSIPSATFTLKSFRSQKLPFCSPWSVALTPFHAAHATIKHKSHTGCTLYAINKCATIMCYILLLCRRSGFYVTLLKIMRKFH